MASKAADNKKTTTKKSTTGTKKANTNKKTTSVKKKTSTTKPKEAKKKASASKTTTVKKNIKSTPKKVEEIQENIETEINQIVENNKTKNIKLENTKFSKRKKKLLPIGIIITILGLIALFVSLVANRIIDREFISDNGIVIMIIISVIIELVGAFIIVNES